jgi:hypothetical protein
VDGDHDVLFLVRTTHNPQCQLEDGQTTLFVFTVATHYCDISSIKIRPIRPHSLLTGRPSLSSSINHQPPPNTSSSYISPLHLCADSDDNSGYSSRTFQTKEYILTMMKSILVLLSMVVTATAFAPHLFGVRVAQT